MDHDDSERLRCLAIVPAFNERHSIAEILHRLRQQLPDFDIVVIDDGSTDDTIKQVPPHCALIKLPFNLGIGGAMQTGYRYAAMHDYDVAVQVDADGQHRAGEVQKLLNHLKNRNLDLVVGSRFIRRGWYKQSVPRRVGAWVLHWVIKAFTGLEMTDCTSGFRACNRRVIHAFAHWYPEDYPEPEVVLLLHRGGYRLGECSVRMKQRLTGTSSISLLCGVFYVAKVVTCLLLDLVRDPWPRGKVDVDDRAEHRADSVRGPAAAAGGSSPQTVPPA